MLKIYWFRILSFFSYNWRAVGSHALHSPFLYDIFNNAIKPSKKFSLENIEKLRVQLKRDHRLIDIYDLKNDQPYRQTISSIARHSLSKRRFSSFLHLLIQHVGYGKIVETGTSLGINTLYLAGPEKVSHVTTLEASPILSEIAKKQFKRLLQHKIDIVQGTIQEKFESVIIKDQPDMCFLDADHRSEVVLWSVDAVMKHCSTIQCIVIHDIYWSRGMKSAWDAIIKDDRMKLTVDLFQAGLIFPNASMPKQHFTIRF